MATCSFNDWVEAYRDDELDSTRRDQFQSHLPACGSCNAELAELAALSGWFAAAPVPRLSQFSMHRLHNQVSLVMEERLLGMARMVSGVAAAILLVCSVWLSHTNSAVGPSDGGNNTPAAVVAEPWAGVSEVSDDSAPVTPAVDYYLAQSAQQNDE
jgi:anti-sigma factor RsiW